MKPLITLACSAALLATLAGCNSQQNNAGKETEADKTPRSGIKLESVTQKASYALGMDMANRLKNQDVTLDVDAFNQGVVDAYAGNEPLLSEADRMQAKVAFQALLRKQLAEKLNAVAQKNLEEGKKFLAENAKKPGVITTESGLQYKVIKKGNGPQPKATDTVITHYRGTLIDGREFDSSYSRNKPATFPVNGVIKGWTEALQMMHVGDKWQLFVPAELAYGKSKRSELIQPNSTLIFDIELLGIKGVTDKESQQ